MRWLLGCLGRAFENTEEEVAKLERCSHDTALRDIHELIDAGVLEKGPGGGRSNSYLLTDA